MGAPPAIIEIHSDIHLSMLGITPVSDDIMQRSEAASDLSFRVVMRLIHRTCRGFGAWTHGSSKVPESLFEFREAMPRKPMFKSRGRSQRDWTREEKVRHYDRMLWITISVRSGCSRWGVQLGEGQGCGHACMHVMCPPPIWFETLSPAPLATEVTQGGG